MAGGSLPYCHLSGENHGFPFCLQCGDSAREPLVQDRGEQVMKGAGAHSGSFCQLVGHFIGREPCMARDPFEVYM